MPLRIVGCWRSTLTSPVARAQTGQCAPLIARRAVPILPRLNGLPLRSTGRKEKENEPMRQTSLRSYILFAGLLLAITVATLPSCGRISAPTGAKTEVKRTNSSPTFVIHNGVPVVPGHAIVRLTSMATLSGFLVRNDLELV